MDVQLPDGTTVKGVPDGTSKADLFAKLKAKGHPVDDSWLGTSAPKTPEQPPQSMTGFVGGNLAKGVAQVAGMPAEIGRQLGTPLSSPEAQRFNKSIGAPTPDANAPMRGSQENIERLMREKGVITQSAEPRNAGQRIAAAGLQAIPSAILPGGPAKALPRIGAAVGGGVGGEVGRQIGGVPGQIAGSLVGGGGLGGMAGAERGIAKPPSEAARASQASGIPLTLGQESGNTGLKYAETKLGEWFSSMGTARADEKRQIAAGVDSVNKLADKISAPQGIPGELQQTNIGEKLRKAYTDTVSKVDSARDTQATHDYGVVRQVAGKAPVIGYQNTMDTLDKIIAENKGVPGDDPQKITKQAQSIKDMLTETKAGTPGVPASPILGPTGQPMRAAIPPAPATTGTATHDIDHALRTRSAWGKAARRSGNIFSDIDPNANQVLAKRLFGAINKDFDAASTAQTPIAQAMKAANQNYAKASQTLTYIEKSALGKLLGEDVADAAYTGLQASTKAPEAIAKKYLSMTPSQARTVTSILKVHQPEVLQDAKAFVLRNGLEQAKSTLPDAPPISFAKFRKEIDNVQPRLALMGFSKKEIADIKDVTDTMARVNEKAGANWSKSAATGGFIATAGSAPFHPFLALMATAGPYGLSKLLLTDSGRSLLKAAAAPGKGQAAAIGALRSQLTALGGRAPQAQSAPQDNTQLASPPQ